MWKHNQLHFTGIALTVSGALMGKTEMTKTEQYDIPSTQTL
jgi:hypothetical protein